MSEYDIRQTLVWRSDLKVRKGKFAAQMSHASMSFLTRNLRTLDAETIADPNFGIHLTEVEQAWLNDSFAKIVLQVRSEEHLLAVHQAALTEGLVSYLITDSGQTEFHGVPTNTCIAIGPDFKDKIDKVTSHLELY